MILTTAAILVLTASLVPLIDRDLKRAVARRRQRRMRVLWGDPHVRFAVDAEKIQRALTEMNKAVERLAQAYARGGKVKR